MTQFTETLPKVVVDEPNAILIAYRGSVAHGMFVPSTEPNSIDDIDIMAVVVPSIDYYFGLRHYGSRGTKDWWEGNLDIVAYEFKKFVNLLCKANPNVLSLLWVDEKYIIKMTKSGELLRLNRDLFSSKLAYNSFQGYAHEQIRQMTHCKCLGYMGEKRKKLVEQFGYDTKNAAHLVRLLKMGIEFVRNGKMQVERTNDRQELLDIKNGKWTLEQVKEYGDGLMEDLRKSKDLSNLPDEPDMDKVNSLCCQILTKCFFYYSERDTQEILASDLIKNIIYFQEK